MAFEILPATPADIPELLTILSEAAMFKSSHGDYLWGEHHYTPEEVQGIMESGSTHIARVDGIAAATVTLTEADERTWGPEMGNDGSALYVHKLASSDRFRGQQLGSRILSWAGGIAIYQDRPNLRLDCSQKLRGYYTSLGFKEVKTIDVVRNTKARDLRDPIYHGILFQKSL